MSSLALPAHLKMITVVVDGGGNVTLPADFAGLQQLDGNFPSEAPGEFVALKRDLRRVRARWRVPAAPVAQVGS